MVAFFTRFSDERYYDLIDRYYSTLIRREQRFTKTAVEWILREISRQNPDYVLRFITQNEEFFSAESRRNDIKHIQSGKK